MDLNLPYFNGYYWCSQIRTQSTVPIIFISSVTDQMGQLMAMQMGADDYITKLIDLKLTLGKIQALLRRTYDFSKQLTRTTSFNGGQLVKIGKNMALLFEYALSVRTTISASIL